MSAGHELAESSRELGTLELEGCSIHRLIECLLRHEAGKTQTCDERDVLVVAMGNADAQPQSLPAASAFARQVGGGPRFINEYELFGIEIELRFKPLLALLQDVRTLLFLGVRSFFLNVIW